jgi:hypothetical protein
MACGEGRETNDKALKTKQVAYGRSASRSDEYVFQPLQSKKVGEAVATGG